MKFLELTFLKRALDTPEIVKEDKAWLTHIRPVIALAKPPSVDLNQIAAFLRDNKSTELGKVGNVMITGDHIGTILKILAKSSRSELVKDSQTTVTQYSAAVPIGLLAYKEAYGTPYSRWADTLGSHELLTNALLGPALADIVSVRDYLLSINDHKPKIQNDTEMGDQEFCDMKGIEVPIDEYPFDPKSQLVWRDHATNYGSVKPTEYNKIRRFFGTNHRLGSTNLSKFYWCMLTQTWIFDPSIRHEYMITDIENWDTLVPPLEVPEVKTAREDIDF